LSRAARFLARDQLIRYRWDTPTDCDSYTAPADQRLGGEPLIVHNRDGRWALCQVFDLSRGRSGVLVFAADRIAAGPIATAWLPLPTPMAFHGVFVPRSGA
jgi:carotenoid cleavage dioxygenase-like enzyme